MTVLVEDDAIRRYGEGVHNIVHSTPPEAPDLLVDDIRRFFRAVR